MTEPCICGHAPEDHDQTSASCDECMCPCYEPDEDEF